MDLVVLSIPLVFVAFAAGMVVGMVVQRRALRSGDAPVSDKPETLRVIDAMVADSIRRLARRLKPARNGDEEAAPLSLAFDGTITLLFSDIARSTSLNRRLGDGPFTTLVRAHDELVREVVGDHDGQVVKTQGDGFMAAFHNPSQAVLAALKLRELVAEEDRFIHPLDLRMGLHTGQAITDAGDVFGESVAFAARVAETARPGEVLVSEALRRRAETTSDEVHFVARLFPSHLKGLPGLHQLHRADWAA